MGSGDRRLARHRPRFLSRKTAGDVVFDVLNYSFLFLFSLTIIYPFWSTILLSFSDTSEATSLGFHVWIRHWTLSAYKFAMSRYGNVPTAYLNSIIRTVAGTLLTLVVTLLAAYPLSKKNLPGRNIITIFILVTMFFSGGIIPSYLLIRSLGLIDKRLVLFLPGLAGGFNIVIMRNFLMTLDKSYEESAFMDGANYLQILASIIVPLSKPVIATVALWTAVGHWNAWFDAMIYIRSGNKIVLQLLLQRMLQELERFAQEVANFQQVENVDLPSESMKAAVTVLTIGPIVIAYPFLQKYFIKGFLMGSLKG
jgi:putative aldouronate transport system permease protein